jgi:hypothetical protein
MVDAAACAWRRSQLDLEGYQVSGKPPISIALVGFDGQEEREMRALFSHSEHWQQPWRVVAEGDAAQIVLLPADSPEELARWRRWSRELPLSRLIAYAEQAPANARWHLIRKSGDARPSLLEFASLLKQIAQLLEANELDAEERQVPEEDEAPPAEEWAEESADEPMEEEGGEPPRREDWVHLDFLRFFKLLFKGDR